MKRFEKIIVLEADDGICYEVSEGAKGEIIIKSKIEGNYMKPPIPDGYEHVCGEWNNGFVIRRCCDNSEFVWIPVGYLEKDGIQKENYGLQKFGRRNYASDVFSDGEYHEVFSKELEEQIESVNKYGGFYISRYNISKNLNGMPQSVKGELPWIICNFFDTKEIASKFEDSEEVKSHLTYGCEYDSVLAWFIKSDECTINEIATNSSDWGNYSADAKTFVETGKNAKWCANNIFDFAGNVVEWTQEHCGEDRYTLRGGAYDEPNYSVSNRRGAYPEYSVFAEPGFRIVLWLK